MAKETTCSCQHHTVMHTAFGVLVLVFGITALLKAMGTVSAATFGWIWPVLVILIGAGWLSKGMCKCC